MAVYKAVAGYRVVAGYRGSRGVAGQGPRVVCERFLENKVHAAQSAAGREAPLRPAGGLGGRCKPPKRGSGQRPGKF